MKFLKKQRIRNAEKAEDCSEIEEMELRLKMMKEHLTIHLIEIDRICPSAFRCEAGKQQRPTGQKRRVD